MSEGFLYVLGVRDIDLPVSKIGKTTRDPAVRCAEINQSATGDFLWEVVHHFSVSDCHRIESLVHKKLSPLRQRGREFFNISPGNAVRAIQSILLSEPGIREIVISEPESAGAPGRAKPRMKTTYAIRDTIHAHLLDGFTQLLGVKGRPFGQLSRPYFGVSDGREGVQWNLAVYPREGRARVGVNLEGMEYRGWPIATLINSELQFPELLRLLPDLSSPESMTLRFTRDAWQVTSRPRILEEYLGGREYLLSEMTADLWRKILEEALGCLDKDRGYRGRAIQAVTRVRGDVPDDESTDMKVSPHLTISAHIDPSSDSLEQLSAAIERLRPIHKWASMVSGE